MEEDAVNYKIIVLGSQGVGKSSLILRYLKGEFSEAYNVTVGVEFAVKTVEVQPGKHARLQIWDTAGQEYFHSIVRSFYQGISAVFFVYAIDRERSLTQLRVWIEEVKQSANEAVVFFLIASKADNQESREVDPQQAEELLRQIEGAFYVETSAKTGLNIELLFRKAAQHLHKKYATSRSFRQLVMSNDNRSLDPNLASRPESVVLKSGPLHRQSKHRRKCCN